MNYIKTILLALLGKYAKTHMKEINKAQRWIDSAQAQFASAIEEATISEQKFDSVVSDAQAKIDELQSVLDEAQARKEQAIAFKNKLQDFLK